MKQHVRVDPVSQGIVAVVLQRAERRNALSVEVLRHLCDIVESLAADEASRVIILTGDGPDFCAGLDLREAADPAMAEQSAAGFERALRTLRDSPLVIVTAVHGGAYAGGAGLIAASDIAVAAEDASIGFPAARRGLLPALVCPYIQPRVRDGDLRDLFLSGEPVSGVRAQQIGLVQRVVPRKHLMEEARSVAEAVIAGGPQTIRTIKRLFRAPDASGDEIQSAWIAEHLAAYNSKEAREGIAAFLEKRDPCWTREQTS